MGVTLPSQTSVELSVACLRPTRLNLRDCESVQVENFGFAHIVVVRCANIVKVRKMLVVLSVSPALALY